MLNTNKIRDYINKLKGTEHTIRMHGHLKIMCNERVVFDQHNLIVNEGKGLVMDILAANGVNYDYSPLPFNAIVLTKNNVAEKTSDTFKTAVFGTGVNLLSNEGVLHIGGAGGGQVSVTHVKGALTIQLTGTISQSYGNDSANNLINSVCLCAGVNANYGGPGQAAYSATGNERVFARVHVGSLIKTVDKSYSFSWLITIQ